jgi:prevent-host-death family protein
MPKSTGSTLDLDVDLQGGVVPISRAASSLAALIKRGKARQQPIIVTQKGYPTGVLLPIDLYSTLRDLAQRNTDSGPEVADEVQASLAEALLPDAPNGVSVAEESPELAEAEAAAPGSRRGRGGRKPKAAQ